MTQCLSAVDYPSIMFSTSNPIRCIRLVFLCSAPFRATCSALCSSNTSSAGACEYPRSGSSSLSRSCQTRYHVSIGCSVSACHDRGHLDVTELTISPKSITFSPRIRNRPRSMSAYNCRANNRSTVFWSMMLPETRIVTSASQPLSSRDSKMPSCGRHTELVPAS